MSDLFHEKVPFEYIDRAFGVIGSAHQHTSPHSLPAELFITEPGASWSLRAGNRKQLKTRQYRSLERAVLCLGDGVASAVDAQREAISAMCRQVMLRRSVAPSFGLCLLALGQIVASANETLHQRALEVLGWKSGGVEQIHPQLLQ
jgi:hypothetical protein